MKKTFFIGLFIGLVATISHQVFAQGAPIWYPSVDGSNTYARLVDDTWGLQLSGLSTTGGALLSIDANGVLGTTTATGTGSVTSVNASVPTGWTVSGGPITTTGTLTFAYDTGYGAVLSASSSNWNSFYDTPSGRITAGTDLSWSGNTLNFDNSTGYLSSVDISDNTNLAVSATGLQLTGDTVALSSGYGIPLTASTTEWTTFYDTPSNRITAGTGLSWSGNTLNASGGGTSVATTSYTVCSLSTCDFTTDGTADEVEINQALSAASSTGGIIQLFPQTYNISSSIEITGIGAESDGNPMVTLTGHGAEATKLVGASGVDVIALSQRPKVHLEKFKIEIAGSGSGIVGTAGTERGVWLSRFNDIQIVGDFSTMTSASWGMYLESPFRSVFSNIEMNGVYNGFHGTAQTDSFNPGNNYMERIFVDLWSSATDGIGFMLSTNGTTSTGVQNLWTVDTLHIAGFDGLTGSKGVWLRGGTADPGGSYFGEVRHNNFNNLNIEDVQDAIVLEAARSNSFYNIGYTRVLNGGNFITTDDESDGNYFHGMYVASKSDTDTNNIIFDSSTNTKRPNIFTQITGYNAAGNTHNATVTASTIIRHIDLTGGGPTVDSDLDEDNYFLGELDLSSLATLSLLDDSVLEADLKAVDTPSDEECLTYETTTGDFEWQTCGGGGSSLFTDGGATTYLTATGDFLAIGTDTASTRLTVAGDLSVANINATGTITLSSQGGSQPYEIFAGNLSSDDRLIFRDTSGPDARYWFDSSSGNTGFSVAEGGSERAYIGTDNGDFMFETKSTYGIKFRTDSGTERMRIDDSTGYVGIGTDSPQSTLHVNGTTTFGGPVVFDTAVVSTSTILSDFGVIQFGSSTKETLDFDFTGANKVTVQSFTDVDTIDFVGITLQQDGVAVGSGGASDFTDLNDVALTSTSTGDLLYNNASGDWVNLGIGTNNQVLTVSGGLPTWQDASGGGGGDLSTTTDIIGVPAATPEILSYITTDFLIGGSSSTTCVFCFDDDGSSLTIASSTSSLGQIDIGSAGVRLSDDGDGQLTLLGLGDGNDEDITVNLDDTANSVVWGSNTGANIWDMSIFSTYMSTVSVGTSTSDVTLDVYGDFRVGTSTDATLFVDASLDRVGIGTTTPEATLVVDDGVGTTSTLFIGGPGGDIGCMAFWNGTQYIYHNYNGATSTSFGICD